MYQGKHWTFTNAWNKPMNLETTLKSCTTFSGLELKLLTFIYSV